MAILGATALTYLDWAKRIDPDGKVGQIINILSQTNAIFDDMLVVEGNLPTGHQSIIRTGLPSATWRLLNYGVMPTKSTTAQITDACGMLETYSDIDVAIAELNGNTASFRMSEDMAFLEGMNQQMATAMFYSNALNTPSQIMGLSPRYNTANPAVAQTANNVIDAGGTGSTNASIWLVVWGPNYIHGIFPKGQVAGLKHDDRGQWTKNDPNGAQYEVYRTHYKWMTGLTVKDWRFAGRIANIDVTQLLGGSAPNLINALIRLAGRIPVLPVGAGITPSGTDEPGGGMSMGRAVIYCNRVVSTYLDIQATNKTNVLLSREEYAGLRVTTFRGIPIRTVDALLNTEARVI